QTAALRSVVEDLLAPASGAAILLEPALSERYPSLREIPGVVSHPNEEELFAAAAGVASVSAAIAETGSIVLVSGADRPRSTALVPITVVAVVGESQIVADLYDWLASLDPLRMPAESVIVTGPSRTADIGMNLVIGVHGPGAVHIVLLTDA
ncbi:MAG: LUD domain-containing protein, partial [Planctomycetes bacterium]|nr:LUD domain-containing protein [Planctomycetota bacterium]